jgi:diguanylate cyclase (GGDEF)-like protein
MPEIGFLGRMGMLAHRDGVFAALVLYALVMTSYGQLLHLSIHARTSVHTRFGGSGGGFRLLNDSGRGFWPLMVTGWAVWRLPGTLRLYVCGLIAAAVAMTAWTAALASWRLHDAALFGLLTVFGLMVVESGRRSAPAEPAGLIKDIYAAWLLPTAILLPPVYGLAAPVLIFTWLQVRGRHTILHRRVFSAAANGLTLGAVSAGFHALPVTPARPLWWLLAAAGCAVAWLIVTTVLTGTAGWLADRTVSIRDALLTPAPLSTDVCELAAGVLIAGAIAGAGLILLVPALPLVVVLQRLFRTSQFDTRHDPQTGLLQAAAWRAEAEVQLARAVRTNAPLTIGIVYVDLADRHGYLAHETALTAAAVTVRESLRPYDLTGRMGQQIVFALPDTTADEARQVAERLRGCLADLPVTAGPGQEPARVAVTLGLAVADAPAQTDLHSLLSVADVALYRAEQQGQAQMCLPATATVPGSEKPAASVSLAPDARPSRIEAAQHALGQRLKAAREQANLTQEELEHISGYKRPTISVAERSGKGGADFWDAMDGALPNNDFAGEHARIKAMAAEARSQTAKRTRQARVAAAAAEHSEPASGAAVSDSACPWCGKSLAGMTFIGRLIGTSPQHTHLPG